MIPNQVEVYGYMILLQCKEDSNFYFVEIIEGSHYDDFYELHKIPKKKFGFLTQNDAQYEINKLIRKGTRSSFGDDLNIEDIAVYRYVLSNFGKLERVDAVI